MKPVCIIPISFSFSIRYIVRSGLLEKLSKYCTPHIILTWREESLIEELKKLGYVVDVIEPVIKNEAYFNVRRKIDFWFDHFKLKSPSKKIQDNFLAQYRHTSIWSVVSKWSNIIRFYLFGHHHQLLKAEKDLIEKDSTYLEMRRYVQLTKAKAVFTVTPFHIQEDMLLRACKAEGLKMLTSILSFDNITKRGWIPVEYDVYMVWNKYNKAELERIYAYAKHKQIHITGAPQFDFYYNTSYLLSREQWLKMYNLPVDYNRKIILYAGGPMALFPDEPKYLQLISKAISNGLIQGNPSILFRCHPVDKIERWQEALKNETNIIFDTSWTGKHQLSNTNITHQDITKLCSTLYYTDVHINLCSTMTIDGSAFNKPQIAPAFDYKGKKATALLQKMYYQEHFLPVMHIDGVALAKSEEQLIQQVQNALFNPTTMIQKCKQVVEEIITYTDGKSTERVADIIIEELKQIAN